MGPRAFGQFKDRGGIAIQLPEQAAQASMPLNAMKYVDVDSTLAIKDMLPCWIR